MIDEGVVRLLKVFIYVVGVKWLRLLKFGGGINWEFGIDIYTLLYLK